MTVLVTGASGFIGRAVVGLLGKTHEVIGVSRHDPHQGDRQGVHWVKGDIDDREFVSRLLGDHEIDAVIHLAWDGLPDYSLERSMNNLCTGVKLIDGIVRVKTISKVMIAGSCWEYGKSHGECREPQSSQVQNDFVWAKNALREYADFACSSADIQLFWFRIFFAYGPEQRSGSILPMLISSLISGDMPDVRSPRNANDFIHVHDLARAFLAGLAKDARSGVYNLGSGESTNIVSLCENIERSLGIDHSVSGELASREQRNPDDFWADISAAQQELAWEPTIPLEAGIREMVDEVRGK